MRILVALIIAAIVTQVFAQTTLLGNCGVNITGIQLSTGNVYCIVVPSSCSGAIDLLTGCAQPMMKGF
jgi:hypothetical protein